MSSTNAAARSSNPNSYKVATVPVSAKGSWDIPHLNASATAQTAAELIRPFSVSSTNVVPIKTHRMTRILLRCRYGAAGAVTTSPSVTVFACYGNITDGDTTIIDDGTVRAVRVVNAQAIPCVNATDVRDTTYSYSEPLSTTGTDILGADFFLVFVSTAASIAGATPVIESLLIN